MDKTTLSSKGQIILPKRVRQAHNWTPGTEFLVEDVENGVLLRPMKPFPRTELESAFASLKFHGSPRTLEEMEAAIDAEARRRHARD